MPKEPKKNRSAAIGKSTRHAPLGQVIQDDANRGKYATRKVPGISNSDSKGNNADVDREDNEIGLLDEKTSKKILDMGREQQREVELEEEQVQRRKQRQGSSSSSSNNNSSKKKQQARVARKNDDSSDEESDDDNSNNEEEYEEEEIMVQHNDGYVTMSSENIGLTPEEEALLSSMMGGGGGGNNNNQSDENMGDDEGMPERRNLADIIMAKIEEKEAMAHAHANGNGDDGEEEEEGVLAELPPKVVQVSRYCHVNICVHVLLHNPQY